MDITHDNVCSSMLSCFYSHLLSTGHPIFSFFYNLTALDYILLQPDYQMIHNTIIGACFVTFVLKSYILTNYLGLLFDIFTINQNNM